MWKQRGDEAQADAEHWEKRAVVLEGRVSLLVALLVKWNWRMINYRSALANIQRWAHQAWPGVQVHFYHARAEGELAELVDADVQ